MVLGGGKGEGKGASRVINVSAAFLHWFALASYIVHA